MRYKGEYVNHFGAVRMRVKGEGLLQMKLESFDDVKTQELVPFQMQGTTDIQPTRLSNFVSQRGRLHVYINTVEEHFEISRIIIFHKPIYSSYPSTMDAVPVSVP